MGDITDRQQLQLPTVELPVTSHTRAARAICHVVYGQAAELFAWKWNSAGADETAGKLYLHDTVVAIVFHRRQRIDTVMHCAS